MSTIAVTPRSKHRNQYDSRGAFDVARINHCYEHPTIGRIFTARFCQPATGQMRTVEIVRFAGAETWKARIRETHSLITRMNAGRTRRIQWEWVSPIFARAELSEHFESFGMVQQGKWEEGYLDATSQANIRVAPYGGMIQ